MSRVGKKPISIPAGVTVTIDGRQILVKGPKGELSHQLNKAVAAEVQKNEAGDLIIFSIRHEDNKEERAQWGTARAIVQNLITGVTVGFTKDLEVHGVGYRVSASGQKLTLHLGYSHEIVFELPSGISAKVEGEAITLSGIDRQLLGAIAAQIRKMRKPEPYKGKGIKYRDEIIRRKAGKAAKAGE